MKNQKVYHDDGQEAYCQFCVGSGPLAYRDGRKKEVICSRCKEPYRKKNGFWIYQKSKADQMRGFQKKLFKNPKLSIQKIKRLAWLILIALFFIFYFLDRFFPGEYRTAFGLIVMVLFYRVGGALLRERMSQGKKPRSQQAKDICFRCGADMKDAFYSIDYCDYCYLELQEEERFREEEAERSRIK